MPRIRRSHINRYMGQGINYLLCDDFLIARAAGAANATPAERGPGTRKTKETDGTLSIASGQLVIVAQATPTWGDLSYYLNNAITRAAGVMMLVKFNLTTVSNFSMGFCQNTAFASPNDMDVGIDAAGPTYARIASLITDIAPQLSAATVYYMAFVLRAAGGYYFIKGGVYTSWTLLYLETMNNTATLYPALNPYASDGTVDFVRVPQNLWLPNPLCYDTFTRADAALGSSEAAGPDGQAASVRAWTANSGTWGVSTNKAMSSAGGVEIATVNVGVRNVVVSAALTRAGAQVGIVASYVDTDNYIYAIHDGVNCGIYKKVGGAASNVVNAAAAYGAGREIKLVIEGDNVTLYYYDAKIGATQVINDVELATGTKAGLWNADITNSIDNFLVYPRGTGNEYSALDKWSA